MIKNGKGGGNTKTGLVFEGKTDLSTFLAQQPHYSIVGYDVYYDKDITIDIATGKIIETEH